MANPKRTFKPVTQTQDDIPIRDFVGGVVVTDKEKFVKVMEFSPIPFEYKKVSEQNKIASLFKSLLKTAPDELHLKSMALQADLTTQINNIANNIDSETNPSCKKMGVESLNRLCDAQKYGVTRRFFVSFPYNKRTSGLHSQTFDDILYNINSDVSTMSNMFATIGNEMIVTNKDNPNFDVAKLFYTIYNRDRYIDEPFEKRVDTIWNRYYEATGDENVYIPPTDLIAPERISTDDSEYLLINDTYYSFLYIPSNGYPHEVITGWIDRIVPLIDGVDVDIFLKRIPRDQVINNIKRSIGHSRASINESESDISESFETNTATLAAAKYLKDGLNAGEDYYNMATIITVSGSTPKEVFEKQEELKKIASRMDVTLHINKHRLMETFNICLPSGTWNNDLYTFKKTRRNLLSSGASSLYFFTSYQINDPKGLYIADDFRGSPVIIDFFNRRRLTNPHIAMFGETGSGKSTAGMTMALRFLTAHSNDNGFVIILAPEKESEFYRVCDAVGGQRISVGAGSASRLNIMELTPRSKEAIKNKELLDGDEVFSSSYLSEKIATLMEFFEMHIADITMEEKQLLNEAIIKTYELKGITSNNDSLWADKEHTKYKKMPIISDLIKVLEKEKDTLRIARIMKLLTTGAGEHFNGETNVDINNRFVVIGLEHNTKDMLAMSIYAAMEFAWNKIKEDYRPCMLWIDEWWKLAYNPIAAERSLQISKLARSMNCSMVISSQQLSDILAVEDGKYGKAVLNNCATKVLLSMKEQDAQVVQEMVGLNDREIEPLAKFRPGQALMVNSDATLAIKFMPSETEKLLIFTDQETRNKYINMKQHQSETESVDDNLEFVDFDSLGGKNDN